MFIGIAIPIFGAHANKHVLVNNNVNGAINWCRANFLLYCILRVYLSENKNQLNY